MIIGIPIEIKPGEYRVALTPEGAGALVALGHRVLCEPGLGAGSCFCDAEYEAAGAELTPRDDLFAEARMIVKVKEPLKEEYPLLREGQILFTYLHLAPNPSLTEALINSGVTAFAYETLESGGGLPLLRPMSEVAGRMAPLMAAYFMQRPFGGRGVLPPGATGVAPGKITVLGAGTVGSNAIDVAYAMGMEITAIDRDPQRLKTLRSRYPGLRTMPSGNEAILRSAIDADVIVGAVLITGARAPRLVTRGMLKRMKEGAVIVDVAIDQGGCVETSLPTTHTDPVFTVEGVVHYCVANMPGAYPRTSTRALTQATLPYIERLARGGLNEALSGEDPQLRSALNIHAGAIVHQGLLESLSQG